MPQVRWITFHSGYDFGYLLKLLTCSSLPANESEFFQLLKVGVLHMGFTSCCASLGQVAALRFFAKLLRCLLMAACAVVGTWLCSL